MSKLKIAIVGCGYWGQNLIRNFSELDEAEVKAVCDFDLTAHTNASGTKLEWVGQDGERYTPHVVEPAVSIERTSSSDALVSARRRRRRFALPT